MQLYLDSYLEASENRSDQDSEDWPVGKYRMILIDINDEGNAAVA